MPFYILLFRSKFMLLYLFFCVRKERKMVTALLFEGTQIKIARYAVSHAF